MPFVKFVGDKETARGGHLPTKNIKYWSLQLARNVVVTRPTLIISSVLDVDSV